MQNDELAELVRQVAAGKEDALGALYDRTSSMVYGLALQRLRQREDAEDATQEVYAQVWRTACRFDARRGNVKAWLTTISKSRALDRVRARALRNMREGDAEAETRRLAVSVPPGPSPQGAVTGLLAAMPAARRRLVRLAFVHGYTHREIASMLGMPLGTVKTHIRRAVAELRGAMAVPAGGDMSGRTAGDVG